MQLPLLKSCRWNRIGAGMLLVVALVAVTPLAGARAAETAEGEGQVLAPATPLSAIDDPPDFLAPAPTGNAPVAAERERGGVIIPFLGTDQAFTLLPLPERPAIAARDVVSLERPELTAGIKVNLGQVRFNLGYTLPSSQVDEFVQPLGVELEPGTNVKRFSLGVKIPF